MSDTCGAIFASTATPACSTRGAAQARASFTCGAAQAAALSARCLTTTPAFLASGTALAAASSARCLMTTPAVLAGGAASDDCCRPRPRAPAAPEPFFLVSSDILTSQGVL